MSRDTPHIKSLMLALARVAHTIAVALRLDLLTLVIAALLVVTLTAEAVTNFDLHLGEK